MKKEKEDMTNLPDNSASSSDNSIEADNVSECADTVSDAEEKNVVEDDCGSDNEQSNDENPVEKTVPSIEEKYVSLNDSHLRLIAEFDNFRKRTLREKAELIKSGGATVLTNLLPVVDDFERALSTMQTTDDLPSAIEGVKLIYDKFISYLSQQGVKVIETVGKPFDTEYFEAIAIIPTPEEEMKGKVIDCVQTGYTLYDKVLRHAKVVVGEK